MHPDYGKTIEKLHGDYSDQLYRGSLDLNAVIAAAQPEVKAAYALMHKPPRYQLYDLEQDPYEFKNLADDPKYAGILSDLKQRLTQWRAETNDPLSDESKLARLTKELQSVKKKSVAKKRDWKYPKYLFDAK